MTLTISPHNLRDSTLKQKELQASKPTTMNGRKYVPIIVAPSIKLPEDHSCTDIHPNHAQDKSQRRFLIHYIRYVITQTLECSTYRGKTRLQCGKSSCDCESAHCAATPTMHDDKMVTVFHHLDDQLPLSPLKTNYVIARLNLDSPQKSIFSALPSSEQKIFIHKRITQADLHNSFNQTAFELQLSATIEGSVITNDFDQLIEKPIRALEDQYCLEIAQKIRTPDEAIIDTYTEVLTIMETAIQNLTLRKTQLEEYFKFELILDEIETDYLITGNTSRIDEYVKSAHHLLEWKTAIIERMSYCTNFDKNRFGQYCHRRDFFWIRAFVKTYELLDTVEDKNAAFENHMAVIQKNSIKLTPSKAITITEQMIDEAQNQLLGLSLIGECNLLRFSQLLFGVYKEGIRQAPSEQELVTQVLEMTKKQASQTPKRRESSKNNNHKSPSSKQNKRTESEPKPSMSGFKRKRTSSSNNGSGQKTTKKQKS